MSLRGKRGAILLGQHEYLHRRDIPLQENRLRS
jgi:hypothetical protein